MTEPAPSTGRGVLAGRGVLPGVAIGPALVCTAPVSGWGGINPANGTIVESGHPQRGASFAGGVLILPGAKGSSGWSGQFHLAKLQGTAPVAIVFERMNSKLALGLVVLDIPAITDLDRTGLAEIRTGDFVRVDGTAGTLTRLSERAVS
ncbi:aconitase X swivel domain-containing protein [Cryptosporangium sp. NPDC048952]|uniref:aconitase X swivel domain-containing protein n=1 Tax=Cryptosporangium sp. NPDC048952 TaxID=3363961 RepID=UPI0037160906